MCIADGTSQGKTQISNGDRLKLPYCILGKLTGIQIILNNMIVVDLGRNTYQWKAKKAKRCCGRDVLKKANILSFKSFGIVMVLTGTVYLALFRTKVVLLGDLPYIKDSFCSFVKITKTTLRLATWINYDRDCRLPSWYMHVTCL